MGEIDDGSPDIENQWHRYIDNPTLAPANPKVVGPFVVSCPLQKQ